MKTFIYEKPEGPQKLVDRMDALEDDRTNESAKEDPSNRAQEITEKYIAKVNLYSRLHEEAYEGGGRDFAVQEVSFMEEVLSYELSKLEHQKTRLKEKKLHKVLDDIEQDLLGANFSRSLSEKNVLEEIIDDLGSIFYIDVLDSPELFGLDKNRYGKEIYEKAIDRALFDQEFSYVKPNDFFNSKNFSNFNELMWRGIWTAISHGGVSELADYFQAVPPNLIREEEREAFLGQIARMSPEDFLNNYRLDWYKDWPEYPKYYEQACLDRQPFYALNMDWTDAIEMLGEVRVREIQKTHFEELLVSSPQSFFTNYHRDRNIAKLPDHWEYFTKAAHKMPQEFLKLEDWFWYDKKGAPLLREIGKQMLSSNYTLLFQFVVGQLKKKPEDYPTQMRSIYGDHFPEKMIRFGKQYHPDLLMKHIDQLALIIPSYDLDDLKRELQHQAERVASRKEELVEQMMSTYRKDTDHYKERRKLFEADPAFAYVPFIHEDWIGEPDLNRRVQMIALVARALYAKGEMPDPANVKRELDHIRHIQENPELSEMSLFKGRDVIMAAHLEKDDSGRFIFGRDYTRRAISAVQDGDGSVKRVRPEKNRVDVIRAAKQDLMDSIVASGRPLTVLMDGHGSQHAWYFSDGKMEGGRVTPEESEKTIKVSYKEIAQAFARRLESGHDISKDILIFDSCESHNLAKSIYEELKLMGLNKGPIIVSSTENMLYGFSDSSARTGASFQEWIFDNTDATLGAFFRMDEVEDHNPSVFIFDESEGDFIQIADVTSPDSSSSRLG